MARRQVLVQLDDELLAELDEERRRARLSRSEVIRRAIRRWLEERRVAEWDREYAEAYRRMPEEVDEWTEELGRIAAENFPPYGE